MKGLKGPILVPLLMSLFVLSIALRRQTSFDPARRSPALVQIARARRRSC